MNTKISKAPKDSSIKIHIPRPVFHQYGKTGILPATRLCIGAVLFAALGACTSAAKFPPPTWNGNVQVTPAPVAPPRLPPITTADGRMLLSEGSQDAAVVDNSPNFGRAGGNARWQPSDWNELPNFYQSRLDAAWPAWVASCRSPRPAWQRLCPAVLQLQGRPESEKRDWMLQNLQVYRVQGSNGGNQGQLTSYYEPVFSASRSQREPYLYPIYSAPSSLRSPWYSRAEIESNPAAQAELKGRAWAFLASPIDVLNLHVQGSARLQWADAAAASGLSRAAYAGSNGHPFQSPFRALMQSGAIRTPTWAAVHQWAQSNPSQVASMLAQNPRYIFFKEETLPVGAESLGPKGAEGVPLTAGRSIAVDPKSIPYGSPVWLSSASAVANLHRLVLAQDTGSAITGPVRADFFAGTGAQAGDFAGVINQNLKVWVLWPKDLPPAQAQ